MTKKNYRKLIAGHLQWSLVGLIIALFVAFISSDHRYVVYGVPATESAASGVLASPTSTSPVLRLRSATTAAPQTSPEAVVPDTINGELVWSDPWDQITEPDRPFY